jgi:large subunit ribosomal protein L21
MYAVIRTAGVQQIVKEGERISVPLLKAEPGSTVKFDDVLLMRSDADINLGLPAVAGASVEARIVAHTHNPKVMIYKFTRRENYRRKKGHRQPVTEVEITKILPAGS